MREDEDSGSFRLHRFEEFIKDDHFTGVVDQMLVRGEWRTRFLRSVSCTLARIYTRTAPSKTIALAHVTGIISSLLTIRMVAALSQLHDDVQQSGLALLLPCSTCQ